MLCEGRTWVWWFSSGIDEIWIGVCELDDFGWLTVMLGHGSDLDVVEYIHLRKPIDRQSVYTVLRIVTMLLFLGNRLSYGLNAS